MRRLLAVAVVVLGTIGVSSSARADLALGAGLSGNFGVAGGVVEVPSSWGVSGTLGYRLGLLWVLEVTPELEFKYLNSPGSLSHDHVTWAFQAMAGYRLGLALGSWVPSAYAHLGQGNVRLTGNELSHEETGPSVEVGGALDYRLFGHLSLGVQVGFNVIHLKNVRDEAGNVRWLRTGVHAAVLF